MTLTPSHFFTTALDVETAWALVGDVGGASPDEFNDVQGQAM